jgi:hypothetical protein
MPLQTMSFEAAVPAVHELTTCPCTQFVVPEAAHAPAPQLIVSGAKFSSVLLSQSSSMPLHVASVSAGVPALHESTTTPAKQLVVPVLAQAPVPHAVARPAKSSSKRPSQSSSMPLQVSSCKAGCPAEHESTIAPSTQCVSPPDLHAPTPHVVSTDA